MWRSAESYDPAAGSPMAWLMTLAHRRAVDRVRSEQAASTRESRYGAANAEPPSDHVADTVILGTVIGGIVVAMYLPIFKLGAVV